MYIRIFGFLLLAGLVTQLAKRLHPTRFGLIFGLFLIYLPFHLRAPLNVVTMVNAITGFLVALAVLVPADSGRLMRRAMALRALALSFLAVSLVGFVISLSAGENPGDLLTLFKRWLDPALFGLLALALSRHEDRKFVIACVTIGYALVAIHAVREGFDYGALKRIPGLLGQPNETGAYLAMYAPFPLALALLLAPGSLGAALVGFVVVAGWGLVFTESRGAMVGYAVGILVTLFASKRTLLATSGLVLAAVVYTLPDVLPERVVARFESTVVEKASGSESLEDELEPSAAGRVQQWTAGLGAMASNPIGFGFNRFKAVIGDYGGIRGLDAHNFFVLVGVEFGIVGLALAAALFFRIGADAWAVARDAPDRFTRVVGVGSLGMLLAALVVNFFGSRLMQEQPSTYLWVLAAMTARAADSLAAERAGEAVVASPAAPGRRVP